MKNLRGLGEYQTPTPVQLINGADISVGFASRLWIKRIPDNAQHRVDDIPKQPPGTGWNDLPQELVDEILGHLQDDLYALQACSLACKRMLFTTRPLIHQRLACFDSRTEHPKPERRLFSRRKKEISPGAFERLIDAAHSGVLHYTQHLTLGPKYHHSYTGFNPSHLQEYLPYLRSITELHTLTLDSFDVHQFIPVFDEYFGMFTNTLRHLDIRRAYCTEQQLLYFICQFPRLEDLTIVSSPWEHPEYPVPTITQSPPLRGKLVLVRPASGHLFEGLMTFPGGLNFSSAEFFQCANWRDQSAYSGDVLAACSHSVTSVSFLWRRPGPGDESELNPSIQVYITM